MAGFEVIIYGRFWVIAEDSSAASVNSRTTIGAKGLGPPTAPCGALPQAASLRLLLQRINGEFKASSVRTVLPATLTIRESCGCKRRNGP
jgi:hypothetical protein